MVARIQNGQGVLGATAVYHAESTQCMWITLFSGPGVIIGQTLEKASYVVIFRILTPQKPITA